MDTLFGKRSTHFTRSLKCKWKCVCVCDFLIPCLYFIGKLILNLTKDTYEELGLEGKQTQFSKHKPGKYGIYIHFFSLFLDNKSNVKCY